jgi:transcriptional regulator with XRE-family HTH domain
MNKLKIYVNQSNLKRIDICKQIGITRAHLSYLENSLRRPSFEVMEKLSKVLNVPIQNLFFEDNDIK